MVRNRGAECWGLMLFPANTGTNWQKGMCEKAAATPATWASVSLQVSACWLGPETNEQPLSRELQRGVILNTAKCFVDSWQRKGAMNENNQQASLKYAHLLLHIFPYLGCSCWQGRCAIKGRKLQLQFRGAKAHNGKARIGKSVLKVCLTVKSYV